MAHSFVKILVLFGRPLDTAEFDRHFETVHRRLLEKVATVRSVSINYVSGSVTGESPFHLVVELFFASEKAMQDGLNSEAGQTMARDYANFASGGVTILPCRSHEVSFGLNEDQP